MSANSLAYRALWLKPHPLAHTHKRTTACIVRLLIIQIYLSAQCVPKSWRIKASMSAACVWLRGCVSVWQAAAVAAAIEVE